MIDIRIEKARPEHLAAVVAIVNAGATSGRSAQESDDCEIYRAAFEAILAAPETDIYVVLDASDDVLGTFQISFLKNLTFMGKPRVELESVHTRADCRGRGIGALMMARADELAHQAEACLIQLTSNRERKDAHRFYERLGFGQSHLGFKKML